jgi:hypothetical protein
MLDNHSLFGAKIITTSTTTTTTTTTSIRTSTELLSTMSAEADSMATTATTSNYEIQVDSPNPSEDFNPTKPKDFSPPWKLSITKHVTLVF